MVLTPLQVTALSPGRRNFTTASMEVFEACPASRVFRGPKERPTHAGMWYGIFVHRFLEYVSSRGADEAYRYIKMKASASGRAAKSALQTCLRIDVAQIPQGDPEVSIAHDVVKLDARQLFGRHQRPTEHEAVGRADLLFSDADGGHHLADYKCGLVESVDPSASTQLLGLAASLWRLYGDPRVSVSLVGVASSGALYWNTVRLDEPRLRAFEDRTRAALLAMRASYAAWEAGETPAFAPGPHCHRCYCQSVCPAVPPPTPEGLRRR